jgi:hypothetical protein
MCSYSEGKTLKFLNNYEKFLGWVKHNTAHMR